MPRNTLDYFIVDAFTSRPFTGNPAAVVPLHCWPTDDRWLQNVAMEMNLSETAFIVPNGHAFDLRWFTPRVEVDLCGHATLASAFTIYQLGLNGQSTELKFSTRSGILHATRHDDQIQMDFPIKPRKPVAAPEHLLEALAITPTYIGKSEYDYLLEVETEDELRAIEPDFTQLAQVDCRGIIVTSKSNDPAYDFMSRFFGPAVGVDEDPVTGSAHCCLANHWQERTGKDKFTAYQASQRGGIVHLQIHEDRVMLSGQAITVAQGELLID